MIDFRQKLEQSRNKVVNKDTPAELEDNITSAYFAMDRGQTPYCLDLRMSCGFRKAVPYSHFTEITFNIDAGIEILTTQKRIKIIGRNLARLFDNLITYRVRYIQTNIGSDTNEDGLFVKEIYIEDLAAFL